MSVLCPFCEREFDSPVKFKNHVLKTDDFNHKLLGHIYSFKGITTTNLADQYGIYKEAFALNNNLEQATEKANEIFDRLLAEKELKKKQEQEKKKRLKIEQEEKEAERIRQEKKILQNSDKRFFRAMPEDERPKALVEFFYSLIGGKCYNYPIEIKLIQGLYLKNSLTANQIKDVLRYMSLIGKRDLRSVNYCLSEALYFAEQLKNMRTEGTTAYLVSLFYKIKNIGINPKKFISEINSIEQTMKNRNLSYADAKKIIEEIAGMQNSFIGWFDSRAVKYLSKNMKSDDPCVTYSDDKEVKESMQYLMNGSIKLSDLSEKIKAECIKRLKDMLKNGSFSQELNYSEFAFRFMLPMDESLVMFIRENDGRRNSFFNRNISDCRTNMKLNKLYNSYINWKKQVGL